MNKYYKNVSFGKLLIIGFVFICLILVLFYQLWFFPSCNSRLNVYHIFLDNASMWYQSFGTGQGIEPRYNIQVDNRTFAVDGYWRKVGKKPDLVYVNIGSDEIWFGTLGYFYLPEGNSIDSDWLQNYYIDYLGNNIYCYRYKL